MDAMADPTKAASTLSSVVRLMNHAVARDRTVLKISPTKYRLTHSFNFDFHHRKCLSFILFRCPDPAGFSQGIY